MSTYYVTRVRKETTTGKDAHEHIIGVVTNDNIYYTNLEVVNSIHAGNEWYTLVQGEPLAKIKELTYCPHAACYHKPYLTTHPDHTTRNNLENLPRG
jgi:hypothetical protein